jgi:ABC-type uncharacterized transport system permease subunit
MIPPFIEGALFVLAMALAVGYYGISHVLIGRNRALNLLAVVLMLSPPTAAALLTGVWYTHPVVPKAAGAAAAMMVLMALIIPELIPPRTRNRPN